jgi:hypothetical protein
MQTSSLHENRPHLESVLGPLSEQDDVTVRAIFGEVDAVLLELARQFNSRAGWEGTGLDLVWLPSGQVSIRSYVGKCIDRSKCVDFEIELWPSWIYGRRASTVSWEAEIGVYADCQHAVNCRCMHLVHSATLVTTTALEAAQALRTQVGELRRWATEFPSEHWLRMAGDAESP